MEPWKAELLRAARLSKVRCDSIADVGNEAHGKVVTALLMALEHDPRATLLIEPRTPDRPLSQNARPADVVILHPDVGCLLVEVKSWSLPLIADLEAGNVLHRVGAHIEADNPWRQAQEASRQIQNATRRTVERRGGSSTECPFFDCIVAFPNVGREEWRKKGFDPCLADGELLLRDDLDLTAELWKGMKRAVQGKARGRLPCSQEQLHHVLEALGSSAVRRARDQAHQPTVQVALGQQIDQVESKQKRLSEEQVSLIEARFDGRPQLIRGVAGSGKSHVLVENLARLLQRQRPATQGTLLALTKPKRFGVVCFNQTLAPFLLANLDEAYKRLTYSSLPDQIDVAYMNGFMHKLASKPGSRLVYEGLGEKPYPPDIMARVAVRYSLQLDRLAKEAPSAYDDLLYDGIYVDEGHDLFEEEFLLLLRLLRPDPVTGDKNLVIFYDDAQNIHGRPRPTWSKLGLQLTGRRSYVMKTCFRNSKPIVEHAFNLLLGVRAETRVSTRGFADTAYLKENNLVEELPDRWAIHFAAQLDGRPPEIRLFQQRASEKDWVAQQIATLISGQHMLPEDILVLTNSSETLQDMEGRLAGLCPDLTKFSKPYQQIAKKDYIIKRGHLTLSTVASAKGYDCPIVFVIGADLFPNDVTGRATFYVAATRAKLQLFITGLDLPNSLAREAKEVTYLLATKAPSSQPAPAASVPLTTNLTSAEVAPVEREPVNRITQSLRRGDHVFHPRTARGWC